MAVILISLSISSSAPLGSKSMIRGAESNKKISLLE
jgi:hypothetical protein